MSLAVGARGEDGATTGVDGDQNSNGAENAGAVYMVERVNGNWQQLRYLKASSNNGFTWFGFSSSLSADSETLAIGARYEKNNASGINGNQRG